MIGRMTGILMVVVATAGWAEISPYAGQETQEISTLSAEDISALEAGQGWEFAKPAELNGWPGPRHVLDLAEELDLTPAQTETIAGQFAVMQAEARRLGPDYLAAERALDAAFRSREIEAARLVVLTDEAGRLEVALRRVHLNAHLATPAVLTTEQVGAYGRLRGYAGAATGGHGQH